MRTPEIITATPVPFDSAGRLQYQTFEAMLGRIEPFIDRVLVSGTLGEFPALEADERRQLLQIAISVFGADRVMAHVGAASLVQVLPLAEDALAAGVRQVACLTPYFLSTDFTQIHQWYATLAQLPGAQVLVYLYPDVTGVDVTPAEFGELMSIDGVIGAKLSGRTNTQFADYVAAAGSQVVYSGNDTALPEVMAAGGAGVVTGIGAAFPEDFARLRDAWPDGDWQVAQAEVVDIIRTAGADLSAIKASLSLRYTEQWGSRLALPQPDAATLAGIESTLAARVGATE